MLVFIKLPEAEQHGERRHQYSHIECDVANCGERSPPPAELYTRPGGLSAFGWFIDGGKHRCPKHFDTEVAGVGPQYRDE